MGESPLPEARRVVLLWIGRLGDLLVATPFLEGLRRAAPEALIVLVTAEAGEGGARLLDCVDEVHVVRKGKRVLSNAKLLPVLRKPADLLIDLNPARSGTSAALASLCKARLKAAFSRGRGDRSFSLRAKKAGDKEPMRERYARLAQALGFECGPRMRVPVREEDRVEARKALAALAPGKPVALFPGNFKKTENRWPEERFAALAGRLAAESGLSPYWLAGPGERPQVEGAAALGKARLPVLGPFPLGVTAAVLESSSLYVGNCTGTSHLAVCVGTPVFTVLAGYTAAVWSPGPEAPHWSAVSADWESCRGVTVDEAWTALGPALLR